MKHPVIRTLGMTVATCLVLAGAAHAGPDRYIDSSDYKKGEEIVGKFFGDEEYKLIVDDLERVDRDIELDWGWVQHSGKKPDKVKDLTFSLSDYRSIRIARPENHAIEMADGIEQKVQEYFTRVFERAGLTVATEPGAAADLALDMAIVDLKSGATSVGWINIEPFIELELRLTDTAKDAVLLLARHQSHSSDPAAAAGKMAGELVRFIE